MPEDELLEHQGGNRLRQSGDDVLAIMGQDEVYGKLQGKCEEISKRHDGVVGFIGIANSPSCGLPSA